MDDGLDTVQSGEQKMTEEQLKELLRDVWNQELSADDAWEIIDREREAPDVYSKEYWLPIKNSA
jgi:hypothetical protein